jgi:uncharacterized protein
MAPLGRLLLAAWLWAALWGTARAQEHPCVRPQEPFVIALCSDPELRALADQRAVAMMAAWSRLSPEDQRRFRSEQLAWRETTARTCQVASSPPPLAVAVKDCLKQAEIARTEFLRHYIMGAGGVAVPGSPATPPVALVPPSTPSAVAPSTAVPQETFSPPPQAKPSAAEAVCPYDDPLTAARCVEAIRSHKCWSCTFNRVEDCPSIPPQPNIFAPCQSLIDQSHQPGLDTWQRAEIAGAE